MYGAFSKHDENIFLRVFKHHRENLMIDKYAHVDASY